MHIPDGFLDVKVWASMDVVAAGILVYAVKKTNRTLEERQIPLMGVMGAFIFAAQMLNFPVAGGTSGHLIGGVLAAVLLGPWAATLVMTAILMVQCFLFQDGGLTALGANVFNMGILATIVGYGVYRLFERATGGEKGRLVGIFVASWVSVELSAMFCAIQLGLSGTTPLGAALLAMVGIHAVIGVFEGVITTAVIGFVKAVRPDILTFQPVRSV